MKVIVCKAKSFIETINGWCFRNPILLKLFVMVGTFFICNEAMAGAIPTPDSGDDPTGGNKDFLDILKNIIQKQAGPILVYGGALFFIILAVFDIYRGYKKYQETDDFGKFKMSLVTGAILVVIGLVLFFLGQYILNQWANPNN